MQTTVEGPGLRMAGNEVFFIPELRQRILTRIPAQASIGGLRPSALALHGRCCPVSVPQNLIQESGTADGRTVGELNQ